MTTTALGADEPVGPAQALLDALFAAHADLLFWQEGERQAGERVARITKSCIDAELGERRIRTTQAEVRGWFEKIIQALKKLDLDTPEVRTAIAAELRTQRADRPLPRYVGIEVGIRDAIRELEERIVAGPFMRAAFDSVIRKLAEDLPKGES